MQASSSITSSAARRGPMRQSLELAQRTVRVLDRFSPVVDVVIRVFIAMVFFTSGLTKIASWSTTVALFENEYAVPLLAPQVAAALGTAVELGFPVLLVLGLGTRLSAFVLFVFNIIAVISYPDLSDAGLKDHMLWGALMLVTFFYGPGKISLDYLLQRRAGR